MIIQQHTKLYRWDIKFYDIIVQSELAKFKGKINDIKIFNQYTIIIHDQIINQDEERSG